MQGKFRTREVPSEWLVVCQHHRVWNHLMYDAVAEARMRRVHSRWASSANVSVAILASESAQFRPDRKKYKHDGFPPKQKTQNQTLVIILRKLNIASQVTTLRRDKKSEYCGYYDLKTVKTTRHNKVQTFIINTQQPVYNNDQRQRQTHIPKPKLPKNLPKVSQVFKAQTTK